MSPMDKYVKNYSKLDKLYKDRRVIISIIPTSVNTASDKTASLSIKKLSNTVKSLLDQTVKVDLISVVLLDKENLPGDLDKSVSVFKTIKNYGELNALIPAIMREGESNTQIIILSDGVIYGKDFIEKLLETSLNNPKKIVYTGDDKLNIRKGVIFSTDMFDETFIDLPDNMCCHEWINKKCCDIQSIKIEYKENYKSL
jgi:hypothetical protein